MPDRTADTCAALKLSTFIPAPPVEKMSAASSSCTRAIAGEFARSSLAIAFRLETL
jgi:hypothetical protein